MAVQSTTNGRVSNLMQSEMILGAIRRNQAALSRAQIQMTTGRTINAPSEDPIAAGRIISLSDLISRYGQMQTNVGYADAFLGTVDASLGDAVDLVRQAHTLGLESIGTTASDEERRGNALVLDSLISQLQRIANSTHQGRYLFDGLAGGAEPFQTVGGAIQYSGGREPVQMALDPPWQIELALDGAGIFGGESANAVVGGDLDPVLTGTTLLRDLRGTTGNGVDLGSITVDDGVNPAVTVDLSGAVTVGDLVDIFNAAVPSTMTLGVTAGGDGLRITSTEPGADITVTESANGATARDLGLLNASGAGATLTGGDVDPRLTERSVLATLAGGSGVDKTGGLTIHNGTLSRNIDLSAAATVQDVINAINTAEVGAFASVSADGRSIDVVNRLSGTSLRIIEGSGTTAADLGLRTFHTGIALDDLAGGRGIGRVEGFEDFRITQRDGTTIDINLDSAATVGDVIDLINNDAENTGDLVAQVGADGGIELVDSSTDAGSDLAVSSLNGSQAPERLGILGSVFNPADTLTGSDVSGVETDGVFAHLLGLQQAMSSNNPAEITRYTELLESDLSSLIEARGTVGAQASQVQQEADRLDQTVLDTEVLLSEVQDLDFTEAVMRFQQMQTQLQASLLSAGRLLNLSLLDFLR